MRSGLYRVIRTTRPGPRLRLVTDDEREPGMVRGERSRRAHNIRDRHHYRSSLFPGWLIETPGSRSSIYRGLVACALLVVLAAAIGHALGVIDGL